MDVDFVTRAAKHVALRSETNVRLDDDEVSHIYPSGEIEVADDISGKGAFQSKGHFQKLPNSTKTSNRLSELGTSCFWSSKNRGSLILGLSKTRNSKAYIGGRWCRFPRLQGDDVGGRQRADAGAKQPAWMRHLAKERNPTKCPNG